MTLPVALLHGFTGSPDSFRAITPALVPRPPFVVAPALVGHGPANADAHVTGFEDEVDRVAALLRERAPRVAPLQDIRSAAASRSVFSCGTPGSLRARP